MSNVPPPEVAAAAAVVDNWLKSAPTAKTGDEIARMTPAQRLDYSRQFKQDAMPAWKDPRK
jgi:hypothetical protein